MGAQRQRSFVCLLDAFATAVSPEGAEDVEWNLKVGMIDDSWEFSRSLTLMPNVIPWGGDDSRDTGGETRGAVLYRTLKGGLDMTGEW